MTNPNQEVGPEVVRAIEAARFAIVAWREQCSKVSRLLEAGLECLAPDPMQPDTDPVEYLQSVRRGRLLNREFIQAEIQLGKIKDEAEAHLNRALQLLHAAYGLPDFLACYFHGTQFCPCRKQR